MTTNLHFGKALKKARESRKISKRALAERLLLTRQRVANLEEQPDMQASTLVKVADAIGADPGEVISAAREV